MTKFQYLIVLLLALLVLSCGGDDEGSGPDSHAMYFPPKAVGQVWESIAPEQLGWQTQHIPSLLSFLESSNTRAFIVLKDGKIVIEAYFNKTLIGANFIQQSNWYWASAGKTLTAATVGLAEEKGLLTLADPTSKYLGQGWTSLAASEENKITVWHQLTMTTGLDDGVPNRDCTLPTCLRFKAAPGNRWSYHNAPYTLLDKVVERSTNQTFDQFFNTNLRDKIGMDGFWQYVDFNHVYFSTARSMARYGLLVLNEGKWANEQIINKEFVNAMIEPSQTINKSYGYLWWLNGQPSFMVPTSQLVINGSITPQAPTDMVAAMGRDSQLLNIVPSKGIVVVRMGDNPETSLVPFNYQNQLWEYLAKIIK